MEAESLRTSIGRLNVHSLLWGAPAAPAVLLIHGAGMHARWWDAVAPVLGAASTLAFHVGAGTLMLYLGFFAGFLLYIGAGDVLPEAHSRAPSATTLGLIALTCLGAIFIFVAVRVAG